MSEDGKERVVELRYEGGAHTLPLLTGTEGETAFEAKTLLAQAGMVTLDPGFANTAACQSRITYIDGEAGILRYRGYPIQELAERSSFLEVAYLLIHGELPGPGELKDFSEQLRANAALPAEMRTMIDALPRDGHPMVLLGTAVNTMAAFYADTADPGDSAQVDRATMLLLAQLPTVAARIYRHTIGEEPLEPDHSLGYVEDFLRMTFGGRNGSAELDRLYARAMDLLLILHADHEQNCSTATVRVVGSSQAGLYGSVASGINALFGPLHGGANQAVLEMLEEIRDAGGDVDTYLSKVKDKESGTRLMGFGHRVYKNFDPRSKEIKELAAEILDRQDQPDELFELALRLEGRALADSYFTDRKLYPNVDFYSGVIYREMGFPTSMFTVLFALGRLPGWIAHWREQRLDPAARIARPRQLYVGPTQRSYAG
ncbi:citrate synthase [Streptomonospora litoralis]|uniref:Citrate synthase n=1 Tax=Streptomonospora litoralis TaxID=2498135 RepID=A0A4P6Q9R1_9ACTN|nr:citrate synthase [Streptomonospora litoralis]QBI56391.1 Citrate synthase 1 [Streptomonospora litoralis]